MRITTLLPLFRVATWLRRTSPLRHFEPLWRRLQPRWDAALGRATGDQGIAVSINGDSLRLTPPYAAYYATRSFEPDVHAALTAVLTEGMSFLDIGAHTGLFTLAAALRVGPSGRVVAFEPSPATLGSLRRHVVLNGFEDRVEIVAAAVGDGEGEIPFFVYEETMSASITRASLEELSPGGGSLPVTEIRVPLVTIDGFCARRGLRPDCVKIDVEGAELRVLLGARELLSSPAEVFCEIHPAQLEAVGGSEEELIALINGCGREIAAIDERIDGIYSARLVRR